MDKIVLFDKLELGDASQREYTPEGYMKVPAVFSRTGIQQYHRSELGLVGDGIVNTYRPPEEVFDPQSMQSLAMKPLTIDHRGDVTVANFRDLAVGISGENVVKDSSGKFTKGSVLITDKEAIKLVEDGLVELSVGFSLELDMTPGIKDGQAYDAVQRKIRGNHIALVRAGRCGRECRLADSAACDCADCKEKRNKMTEVNKDKLQTVVIDGVSVEVNDAAKNAIDALQARIKTASDNLNSTQKQLFEQMNKYNNDIAAKDAEIKKLQDSNSPEARAKARDESLKMVMRAIDYLPDDYDTTGKTDAQIAKDAVASHLGPKAIEGKTDDHVLAMFDTITNLAASDGAVLNGQGANFVPNMRAKDAKDNGAQAYRDRMNNAWKGDQAKATA